MDPKQLKAKRAELLDSAQAIIEAAEGENRELNTEECELYDSTMAEVKTLADRISRIEEHNRSAGLHRVGDGQVVPVVSDPHDGPSRAVPLEELGRYSLCRLIRAVQDQDWREAGFEREVSDAIAKRQGISQGGLLVPLAIFNPEIRQVEKGGDGGSLVGTDHLGSEFIDVLRNRMVAARAGARVVTGLVGDLSIPRQTGSTVAYWIGETGPVTPSDPTFDNLPLAAKQVAATTAATRLMVKQSSPQIEEILRNDLAAVLARGLDLAALHGTGAANQPTGITNTVGVGTVTFGGAPTWPKVVELETAVAAANADMGALAYAVSARLNGELKTIPKEAGQATYLAEGGEMNGYPVLVSNQVEVNTTPVPDEATAIFGDWSQLIVAIWGEGVELVVDPFTQARNAQIYVTGFLTGDIGVRQPAAFAFGADAQLS